MLTQIYDLSYEVDEDGGVNLEQDAGCGEVSRITLHPVHVRLLAEEAGILAPSSNIEADRTIARLSRQMRLLFERIDQLDDWLNQAAQRGHEDLAMETTYSFATWELAQEFVTELPIPRSTTPKANTRKSGAVSTGKNPESGGVPAKSTGKGADSPQALTLEVGK